MKETLKSIGITVGVIALMIAPAFFSEESETAKIPEIESTSWEADTESDKPQEYYENDYVDSDYVEERGTDRCTQDCGGHSAGYDWAEENEVCDDSFDGGNSESFAEGVREYAEEYC